ncbi:hypothetical protein PFISCL1PPCAC_12722, partial [Pristionchus fissidentatus]
SRGYADLACNPALPMVVLPRNRRPPPSHSELPPQVITMEKVKKRDGLRWQHYVTIAILLLLCSYAIVHYHDALRSTIPARLRRAHCNTSHSHPSFVHCKERETHNREFLQFLIAKASNLTPESIAEASATYALSLAMRTEDTKLGGELYAWMLHAASYINCYKLLDNAELPPQPRPFYPRSLCAAAVYKDESRDNDHALEDFHVFNDIVQLVALYGSQFHEGTLMYTADAQLRDDHGVEHPSPRFAGIIADYYPMFHNYGHPYTMILEQMTQRRNDVISERVGTTLLVYHMRTSLAAMAACQPRANDTWRDYHERALRRNLFTGGDCGWAQEDFTFGKALWYFLNDIGLWNVRRLMKRI